jgi:hypothetical protein
MRIVRIRVSGQAGDVAAAVARLWGPLMVIGAEQQQPERNGLATVILTVTIEGPPAEGWRLPERKPRVRRRSRGSRAA